MSEHNEASENKQVEEIEKIDIMNLVAAFLNAFKRLWVLLVIIVAVCTARSYFSTSFTYTPQYVASATVSVTTPGGSYAGIQSAQEMAAIFPYILTSGVLEDVVKNDMGLDTLPGQIGVKAEDGMNMLTISVSSNDPQMAYNELQSVIKNYPEVAEYIFGETRLQILDETGIPSDTQREVVIRGSYKRGALQGVIISGVIMCLYVFLKRTVRTKEQLNKKINLHDLGSIPYVKLKKRKKSEYSSLTLLNERISPAYEEAIKRLRIRVMHEAETEGSGVIMVTSSIHGEGKTTIAVNLAIAIARQGKSVILADCDPRNPSVAEVLPDGKEHPGIGAVLRGKAPFSEALTDSGILDVDLKILYGGEPNSKDAALLGSRRMEKAIRAMEKQADYVILDTAPAELLADASLLGKYVDFVLYVVRCDYTKMSRIREGIEMLSMRDVNILGYIFNGDVRQKSSRYGYGYGYGYGRYGRYGGYSHYSHYGKLKNTGKREDSAGRVIKE